MIIRTLLTILLWTTLFVQCQGLHIHVSRNDTLIPTGSNLHISCSDKRPFDMEWLLGTSHLSSCSLRPDISDCLPGGRFVVNANNDTFQLNLVKLAIRDCGTYTCKTKSDQKTYTLKLIEHVTTAVLSETDHALTVTTSCVVPGYTVDIRWYYIHKDGTPRLYHQPTSRLEQTNDCSGACLENNLVRVSSTLQLPTTVRHPLTVKLRATILQDGRQWHYISTQDYTIEGCPTSVADIVLAGFLGLIVFLCVLHLGFIIYVVYSTRLRHCVWYHVSGILYRAIVSICGVGFSISEVILLQKGVRLQEACDSQYSTHLLTPAVVTFFGIALAATVTELPGFLRVSKESKAKTSDGKQLKTEPMGEDENQILMNAAKEKETDLGSNEMPECSSPTLFLEKQLQDECLMSLSGSVQRRIRVKVGQAAILKINNTNKTKDYPSWQKLNECVLSNGESNRFLTRKPILTWGKDKQSIIINNVQTSDAGTYICIMSGGEVQAVDLVVCIPVSKPINIPPHSSIPLPVHDDIQGTYPQWRRWCVLNECFQETFHGNTFKWATDKKGLFLRDVSSKDEGMYEVFSNNCVQEIYVRVQPADIGPQSPRKVDTSITVRLECPNENGIYPSWYFVKHTNANKADSSKLLEPISPVDDMETKFRWSVDKRSLLIRDVGFEDGGTYICRMTDGTCITIKLILKDAPELEEKPTKSWLPFF